MTRRIVVMAAVVVAIGAAAAVASELTSGTGQSAGPRVPVLAELFTSEGCSSCPPADDLLRQLLRDQPIEGVEVIAISEHVDYWNRLGWRDPFSSPLFSERQGEYARAFGGEQIYTPQLVVNGRIQVIGNDHPAVLKALVAAAQGPRATLAVTATRLDGGKASIQVAVRDVPTQAAQGSLDVMVAVVENDLVTDVPRGENARMRLRHDAVARLLGPIGSLLPKSTAGRFDRVVDLGASTSAAPLRVVAFLQDRSSRAVAGVAAAPIAGR